MTAEVVVCNTLGLALAADSAATVNSKVLNSANKVFALTKHHPVGVMINGSSTLSSIPWEVLIKEYRKHLGNRSLPHLKNYAEDFFHFINANPQYFDDKFLELEVWSKLTGIVNAFAEKVKSDTSTPRPSLTRQSREFGRIIDREYLDKSDISRYPYVLGINKAKSAAFFNKMKNVYDDIADDFKDIISSKNRRGKLLKFMNSVITQQVPRRASSSLVFCGFGERDIFPQVVQYDCDAFFGGVVWRIDGLNYGITSLDRAAILPFAQDDVVSTFIDGVDPELYDTVKKFVEGFGNDIKSAIPPTAGPAIDQFVNSFFQKFDAYRRARHVKPLIDMVAVLPVDELAQLAESLVSITSLKRHVSQDMETVGGPIDVAVITRGDGLVWVSRKHYFDPKLNPDYFARQRAGVP